MPYIETERLTLRPLTPDDLGDLHRQLSDAGVMRYYPSVMTLEESQKWLDKILADYEANGFGMLAVTLKQTSEFIGQAGVMRRAADDSVHYYLAYLLLSEFWGHGYATEAVRGLVDYAFNTLRAPVVEALIRPENEPSLRVAERLSMRQTGTITHAGFVHGVYAIAPADM